MDQNTELEIISLQIPYPYHLTNLQMLSASQDVELKIIAQAYELVKKIDEGAFGKIYKATRSSEEFAIKLQPMKAEFPQLIFECKLYHQLHSDPSAADRGFPMVFECGVQGKYNYLVMQLMGPSLQNLLNQCNKKFTLKTTLMLLDQMISNIQYFHSRRYIHRDIKPDNYCMGSRDSKHLLYLLDFGLAKQYIANGKHIAYKEGKSLTGTVRYASVNTHLGVQQSRRDDMESIGYVAIYLARGFLPWQGQKSGNKQEKYQKIKMTKMNTTVQALCRTFPKQFEKYMLSVRNLKFTEEPHYELYKKMFRNLFSHLGFKVDYEYDWSILKESKQKGIKEGKECRNIGNTTA